MKTIFTLIGYRPYWVDTCRGCVMERFDSMSYFAQYSNLDNIIEDYAKHMVEYDDEDKYNNGGTMDFILMVDQYVVWKTNGSDLYDEGCLSFDNDADWDTWEEAQNNLGIVYDLAVLAKDRIAELKADRNSKNKALVDAAKKREEEQKRKSELAELERLKKKYPDD